MITKYVQAATVAFLGDPNNGFNPILASVSGAYNVAPFTIDWTPNSLQFTQAYMDVDDAEDSAAMKYPHVFLYGAQSQNIHESMGRLFSGRVVLDLSFWFTHKATSYRVAGPALENLANLVEDTSNRLFSNGNWPQGYGASSAICVPPAMVRDRVRHAGEMWRQAFTFRMVFTLDTN